MSEKTAILLKIFALGVASVLIALWTANLQADLCILVVYLHVFIGLGLAWKLLIPQAVRFIKNEFNRTDDFPSNDSESRPASTEIGLGESATQRQINPARFSALMGIAGCGVGMIVTSLIEGDGRFVWNGLVLSIGFFAGILGVMRGWLLAKSRNAVVLRTNKHDDSRCDKPFGEVPPEVIENLTPSQRAILKAHLEQHPD